MDNLHDKIEAKVARIASTPQGKQLLLRMEWYERALDKALEAKSHCDGQ